MYMLALAQMKAVGQPRVRGLEIVASLRRPPRKTSWRLVTLRGKLVLAV